MIHKPFSQACENNKNPILEVIQAVFCQPTTVWEIGSGTGQHACYFVRHLPHIEWQPTDRSENILCSPGYSPESQSACEHLWPVNYNGAYTSESNARFDQWLKSQNPLSCIKNFEDIMVLAKSRGLALLSDIAMPANNRLLVLQNS